MRIGIDLDNTLIFYDDAFINAARERGLIPREFSGTKQQLRDRLREVPDMNGELEWQKLQGYVYGQGIHGARLFGGVEEFFRGCRAKGGLHIVIISHKTEYGHYDPAHVNLHQAAREFLRKAGFFDRARIGLTEADLYFEGTRREKVARIAALDCDVFIDDLPEVFEEPGFPAHTRRLLLTGSNAPVAHATWESFANWCDIARALLEN